MTSTLSPAGEDEALARILRPAPPSRSSAVKRLPLLARTVPAAADLVLLGDSLAAGWPPEALAAPGRRVFNFGLPGDRIQNQLWRLREGGVAHLRPRQIILVLGTNNFGDGDPPDAILIGLREAAAVARRLWGEPDALLVTIPWRGDEAGREADRLRLNAALLGHPPPVASAIVVDADRALGVGAEALGHLDPDRVHINAAGYERLGAAVRRLLDGS